MAARLAELQYTLGEGPCMGAVRLRAPAFATDLTRAPDSRRWPLFSVQATRAGAEAVFSVPLGSARGALGTLDLYRGTAGSLGGDHVHTALLVADAVTLTVATLDHAPACPDGVVTWMEGAESDREEVHQATGKVMVHLGVSVGEALLLCAPGPSRRAAPRPRSRGPSLTTMDIRSD
ncbi:GAF domain-containing protein [Streptomyces umbrinus]|uniref:GAF domain-containing protein n=1 Tax=Streptomyces umbrinus TaxID=67370 RepID=UPI0035947337